jgi:GTP-binding nuclear protein Ran
MERTFKLILAGDAGVGKTTFINRHLTGAYTNEYIPTIGVDIHSITFHTNDGNTVTFNVWDCAGDPKFGGGLTTYYDDTQCAIVLYDCTSETSSKRAIYWKSHISSFFKHSLPVVVYGNKCDIQGRHHYYEPIEICTSGITRRDVNIPKSRNIISCKSNYNFELPFLELAQQLTNNPNLEFVAAKRNITCVSSPATQSFKRVCRVSE